MGTVLFVLTQQTSGYFTGVIAALAAAILLTAVKAGEAARSNRI